LGALPLRGGEEMEGKGRASLPKVNFLVTSIAGEGGRGSRRGRRGEGREGREGKGQGKGKEEEGKGRGSLRHCRWGGAPG